MTPISIRVATMVQKEKQGRILKRPMDHILVGGGGGTI